MNRTKKDEPVDMSPRAVARRLDEVRDLFRLTEYLVRFQPVTDHSSSGEHGDDTTGGR